jgi:uncharacterized protein (TIGR04222 family)
MRQSEHNMLWEKIVEFSFDDQKAAITFSNKLATQQKWSVAYTQRVIEEYRRFIFLCCILPNGASPSKAVDEAWHLHLTYTQSYWIAFCKNTLGKDIHHHPSAGGDQENHKHEQWYAETLALYEEVFGTTPPADIWPSTAKKESTIPPTKLRIQNTTVWMVVLLLLLPFVISFLVYDEAYPFYLKGPQFLWFYLWLSTAALIGNYLLRKDKDLHLQRIVEEYFPGDLTIYQLTHLLYGKHRAIQTGVIDLYRRDLLTVDDNGNMTVHNKRYTPPPKEENPLVPGFLAESDGAAVNYKMNAVNWYTVSPLDHPQAKQLYYLAYDQEIWYNKFFVIIIAVVIGIARLFQGLMNHRPVEYLVFEMVALIGIAFFLDKILIRKNALLQKTEEQLRQKTNNGTLGNDAVVNDFAMNGQSALTGLAMGILLGSIFSSFTVSPLTDFLNGNTGMDRDWDSGSRDSGSSDSSCSGGSSCGGGGGCGGCSGSSD